MTTDQQAFAPTFDSLRGFECPDWFRDAKFGIWSHWGPQSVPMYGDWYARWMYVQGSPQNLYHVRKYGHPSEFGYKDVCALWKAESFDPDALMDLYVKAGARYFVAQAMHHDNFFNYASQLNRMNSVEVGPKKDIVGLWQQAARRHDLPFGLTEHLGASHRWWRTNKGSDSSGPYQGVPYDGSDPAWRDFYLDNADVGSDDPDRIFPWYPTDEAFRRHWVEVMKELIDLYTPELLYSDGPLPFAEDRSRADDVPSGPEPYAEGLEVVSHLYNASVAKHGDNQAIYTQKDRDPEVYQVGVLDIEKSQLPDIAEHPWQTDTCIGNWFYDVRQTYKTAAHVVEMLVDIIAKNGTMLLNILQKPDGTIDDEARFLLEQLADWMAVCSEGVHGTRPWKRSGEGPTAVALKGFEESKAAWTEHDFRFTQKDGTVYAFMMGRPTGRAVILRSFHEGEQVRRVRLLGAGELEFTHHGSTLMVELPDRLTTDLVNCLALELG